MRPLETLIAVTLFASPALSPAQDSTTATVPSGVVTTMAGVYTEQQAGRGEMIYRNTCVACHDASDHTGATFKQNWNARTAFDLFETIRTTMPNDDPGTLLREDYANIVAYLFKANRMPSGTRPLPSDSTALAQIVIAVPNTIRP
jgi:mono/diheme cytochrome c family protein